MYVDRSEQEEERLLLFSVLLTADVGGKTPEEDSVQSTVSYELFELLSGLSHACQLINVIAFYLHITLPFRLHQLFVCGSSRINP